MNLYRHQLLNRISFNHGETDVFSIIQLPLRMRSLRLFLKIIHIVKCRLHAIPVLTPQYLPYQVPAYMIHGDWCVGQPFARSRWSNQKRCSVIKLSCCDNYLFCVVPYSSYQYVSTRVCHYRADSNNIFTYSLFKEIQRREAGGSGNSLHLQANEKTLIMSVDSG